MSTPTQTGAQAPSIPSSKKNRASMFLAAALVVALGVIAYMSFGSSGGSTPVAAVSPSTTQASVTTTETPVTTIAPAPATTVAPVTTAPAATTAPQPVGILTKPVAQNDYQGWAKYLQSVYASALRTSDPALLNLYFDKYGAVFTHNTGSNSGVSSSGPEAASQMFGTNIGTVDPTSIQISRVITGLSFDANFTQGSSRIHITVVWMADISTWQVQIMTQND